MNNKELLTRLQDFAVCCLEISNNRHVPHTASTLLSQLSRSGVSPALNYAEAMGAASVKDFVGKLNICQKELRETLSALAMLRTMAKPEMQSMIERAMDECNQLIAIMVASIKTTRQRYSV